MRYTWLRLRQRRGRRAAMLDESDQRAEEHRDYADRGHVWPRAGVGHEMQPALGHELDDLRVARRKYPLRNAVVDGDVEARKKDDENAHDRGQDVRPAAQHRKPNKAANYECKTREKLAAGPTDDRRRGFAPRQEGASHDCPRPGQEKRARQFAGRTSINLQLILPL